MTSGENLLLVKNQFKIVVKILYNDSASNYANEIKFKCLSIRGVMKVRPPPGGPIAAKNVKSSSVFHYKSFLSYQP